VHSSWHGDAPNQTGHLAGLASILPGPALFIYLCVRKEAVRSSQIAGTHSSFSDLMLFESAAAQLPAGTFATVSRK